MADLASPEIRTKRAGNGTRPSENARNPPGNFSVWFNAWVWVAIGANLVGYLILATGAEALPLQSASLRSVRIFLATMTALWLVYLGVIVPLIRGWRMDRETFWCALVLSFVARALLVPTDPILDDTFQRQMWDGRVASSGANPYRLGPNHPDLASLRLETTLPIPHSSIGSHAPPLQLFVHAASDWLYPENPLGMKLVLVGFDIATVLLLVKLLQDNDFPIDLVLIYAWCPLVVREIANGGHADSLIGLLICGLLLALQKRSRMACAVMMGLLLLSLETALLLIPIVVKRAGARATLFATAGALVVYLPFGLAGARPGGAFHTPPEGWRLNMGIYEAVRWVWGAAGGTAWGDPDRAALVSCACLVLLISASVWWRLKEADSLERQAGQILTVLGSCLLCSRTFNPWFLVWLAPLWVFCPRWSWLFLVGAAEWFYLYYPSRSFPIWMRPMIFLTFFVLLYVGFALRQRRRALKPS